MAAIEAWSDLDDALAGPEPDYDTEPSDIADLDEANRTLRRVARIRRERARDRATVAAEATRLREWAAEREGHHQRAEAFHLARLRHYHEAVLRDDPRAKTLHLPNGTLKTRHGQPRWVFDDATFVEWARTHGALELLHTKYEPDRTTTKRILLAVDVGGTLTGAAVTAAGELVPGVEVLPPEDSFTVDTSEVDR